MVFPKKVMSRPDIVRLGFTKEMIMKILSEEPKIGFQIVNKGTIYIDTDRLQRYLDKKEVRP